MRSRTKVTLLFVLLVLLMSVGVVSAQDWTPVDPLIPGGSRVQRAGLTVTGPSPSAAEEQAMLAYWSRERILAAKPMELPVDFAASEPDLSGIDAYAGRYGAAWAACLMPALTQSPAPPIQTPGLTWRKWPISWPPNRPPGRMP